MSLAYVCNVERHEDRERPLIIPVWNFNSRRSAAIHNAGRNGKFRRLSDGEDVSSDGHDDDASTPGDPGVARFGKPSIAGMPQSAHRDSGCDVSDGGDDAQPEEPLVLPRMPLPRRAGVLGDLKGCVPRTPADVMAAAADNDPDGSEADGMPVQPWPPELFQKRGRR